MCLKSCGTRSQSLNHVLPVVKEFYADYRVPKRQVNILIPSNHRGILSCLSELFRISKLRDDERLDLRDTIDPREKTIYTLLRLLSVTVCQWAIGIVYPMTYSPAC